MAHITREYKDVLISGMVGSSSLNDVIRVPFFSVPFGYNFFFYVNLILSQDFSYNGKGDLGGEKKSISL